MRELALFAGAGGGLYGTKLLGWTPVCAVEKEAYRRAVLHARQGDGTFERFPIWDDIRTFPAELFRERVDVVTAGFPCQPFSLAGARRGEDDERNLWPDTIRIIREIRPRFALLENVPGLLSSGYFGRVLGDLAECGYDAEWCVLGANDVGAPHRRKRLWILAYLPNPIERKLWHKSGWNSGASWSSAAESGDDGAKESLAYSRCSQEGSKCQRADGSASIWKQTTAYASGCGEMVDPNTGRFKGEWSSGLLDGERSAFGNDADACDGQDMAHSISDGDSWRPREPGEEISRRSFGEAVGSGRVSWWGRDPADEGDGPESFVGRVAHGVANRRHRLAALGDGQVPAVVQAAWRLLAGRIGA